MASRTNDRTNGADPSAPGSPHAAGRLLSAGVMVLRPVAGEWRVLLLRAYQYWDAPKGLVEAGEDPFEAACREVEEETLILDLRFPWGRVFRETEPYGKGKGKIARYYLAETRESAVFLPHSTEIGKPEHDEHRWVTFDEALTLVSPRVRPIVAWARETSAGGDKNSI